MAVKVTSRMLSLYWTSWVSMSTITTGAKLLTFTVRLSFPLSSSSSEIATLMVVVAGPSGKVQSKLPAPVEASKLELDSVPPVPQVSSFRMKVSSPGSLTV